MSSYHIPEPCHEDWGRMSPAERGRHCAVCDKTVVDLSDRSSGEARALLDAAAARAGAGGKLDLCARVRVDRSRRLLLGRARRYVLSNALAAMLAWGATACAGDLPSVSQGDPAPEQNQAQSQIQNQTQHPEELPPVPGGIAVEPPPAPPPQPVKMGEIQVEMGDVCVPPVEQTPEPVSEFEPPRHVLGRIAPQPRPPRRDG